MLITRNGNKKIEFGVLHNGDVFKDDDEIYMVCDEIEKDGTKWNAVNLETGHLCYFFTSEKVIILKAEIIIN